MSYADLVLKKFISSKRRKKMEEDNVNFIKELQKTDNIDSLMMARLEYYGIQLYLEDDKIEKTKEDVVVAKFHKFNLEQYFDGKKEGSRLTEIKCQTQEKMVFLFLGATISIGTAIVTKIFLG